MRSIDWKRLAYLGLLTLFAFLYLHPNPFGNQPNAVFDENLFITSALGALSKPTLPGWDFTAGGSYYGGPIVYVVTLMIGAMAAWATVAFHSVQLAQTWLLLHTGDLMETTRLANAGFVLAAACGLAALATRLKRSSPGAERALYLLAGLLFSNSMFVTLTQTGKVWILQILLDLAAACAVFRFETLKRAGAEPERAPYARILLWTTFLAFLQNEPGVVTGVWILYALYLGHLDLRAVLAALKRDALPMIAVAVTQISFFARFFKTMFDHGHLTNAAKAAFVLPDGSIDWAMQIRWPLERLPQIQPLVVPFLIVIIALIVLRFRKGRQAPDRWHLVLVAHPVLTYLYYHVVVFHFGNSARYLLPFSVACCLTVAFLPMPRRLQKAAIVIAWSFAAIICAKTAWLYWQPSSEQRVVDFFDGAPNRPGTLISVEGTRLELPLNVATLEAVQGTSADTRRYGLLRGRSADVVRLSGFAPLVWRGTTESAAFTSAASSSSEIWEVKEGCERRCTTLETSTGACFGFNDGACETGPTFVHEGENYHGIFTAKELGSTYFARRVK